MTRRGENLWVTLTTDGGDVAGALARAMNWVFDRVPGEAIHGEATLASTQRPPTAKRRT